MSELRARWINTQNSLHNFFSEHIEIKKDMLRDISPEHSVSDARPNNQGLTLPDREEILMNAEWLHGSAFTAEMFENSAALGDKLECKNFKWLEVARNLKQIGNNIHFLN